ncbi:prolyl oligopeptidase family serine peptidase (plasmid) [Roseibium aggregatum]|nr:prolyl oligopeptidase family serine peptidase [Roseibium aggregatum]
MVEVSRHIVERSGGAGVELFQAKGTTRAIGGAMLIVHGNQGGSLLGAKEVVDSGALVRISSRLNITAAAVSQPGFGASEGPSDFCGPSTQQAIIAALSLLQEQPSIDPRRIVLFGNSRGAVASAMVATKFPDLRAVILSSGAYDLREVYLNSFEGLRRAIRNEAGLSIKAFLARSALHHAHKIQSEILLLHGRHDDRAPVAQAETFYNALSAAGVPVTFNVFECGHRIPRSLSNEVILPFLEGVFENTESIH